MKAIHWIIAAAAPALVQTTPAPAGINDPEIIIYRFPGVRDTGGLGNSGIATTFHCTNFSGATQNLRFVTRNFDTVIKSNTVVEINHLATLTLSTQQTSAYSESGGELATGVLVQGTTAIAATSINIICTAMTIDAGALTPIGVSLRGIRFSPVPGSQE